MTVWMHTLLLLYRTSSFLNLYLASTFSALIIMFLPHALVNQVLKGCVNAHTALPSSEDYRTAVFKHFTQSAHSSYTRHALYSSHLCVSFTLDITLPKAVRMKHFPETTWKHFDIFAWHVEWLRQCYLLDIDSLVKIQATNFTGGASLSVLAEWTAVFAHYVFIKSSTNMVLKVFWRIRWFCDHGNQVYGRPLILHFCLWLVPYSWKHSTLSLPLSNRITWSQWSTSGTTFGPLKICTTGVSSNQQWRTPGFQILWLMGIPAPQTLSPPEVKGG